MSANDDRLWKAEDLLKAVIEKSPRDGGSPRDCIDEFFDNMAPPDDPTTPAGMFGARADAIARPARQELPTEPPVSVPNHELIRCLGAGGFGQVWLARHALTEHHRACKLIPSNKAVELDGLRHLKQRVPTHPNLFPIEDVGAAEDWLYCLMPLADAASTDHAVLDHTSYKPLTLDVHLERHGRRPSAEVESIGLELAEAVRHLHVHGVTHGDIKPANIMRLGGRWTLADYGLARDLSDPSGGGHTLGYAPPEGPGSTKADQFALGVLLMQLLTNWPARMLKNFRATPIERFKLDALGPRMAEVVLRASADDPSDRFGSIDELIETLGSFAPSDRAVSTPRRTRWLLAVSLPLAAAVVAAVLLVNRTPTPPAPDPTPLTDVTPLGVESFEVRHYRYDAATDQTLRVGPINADNPAARVADFVTVHARFTDQASFFLLSLDADGRVRPRIPALTTETPALADGFDYPSDPVTDPAGYLYELENGPGAQGFMLLVSDHPLPPWSDWIAARGEPTWTRESLPANGVILFDGIEATYDSVTRDPAPRRGQLVLDPIDWARSQQDLSAVRFIAFPVLPKEEH